MTEDDGRPPAPFLPKKEANDTLRMECMRHCILWGKDYAGSKEYFALRHLDLDPAGFRKLVERIRGESRDWYTEGALTNWEHDHRLGIMRLSAVEDRLMQCMEGEDDPKALSLLSSRLCEVRGRKDAMMESTPLVQELMRVHRQRSLEAPHAA